VGGAAGTVAKSVSAYDMAVSDAMYGPAQRYVSRQRLQAMLEHEFSQLLERLGTSKGETTAFFAFADTVATRKREGTSTDAAGSGCASRPSHASHPPPHPARAPARSRSGPAAGRWESWE
jgi:hypothetical protein